MGKNVMNGSPISDDANNIRLYEKGVKYANIGLFLMALLSIPISLIIPKLCQIFGSKIVWFLSCLIYCIVFIVTTNVMMMKEIAVIMIALCSFPLAASKVIGWTIVTKELSSNINCINKRALYTTIFNLANCSPGVIVAIVSGFILVAFNHNVSSILIMGAISSLLASLAACFIVDI